MIIKIPGIRSKGSSPNRSSCQGFTLVELMMTIVLLGVGVSLALPSFRDMVEKRQVTNGAEQLASFINTAQGVSMRNNEVVTVSWSYSDGDTWCVGAVAGETACDCNETDTAASDYCQIASQPFILNNGHTGDLDLMHNMNGDGAYAFDPIRGLLIDLDDSFEAEIRSPSDEFRLNLLVNGSGRVIVCSDDSTHGVPGYDECPQDEEGS